MLVAGDREADEGTIAVRRRGTREQEVLLFDPASWGALPPGGG